MLLLLRLTGANRRPGPTSTRWIVALANLTVAPGDMGRTTGEVGGDTESESGFVSVKLGSVRERGDMPAMSTACSDVEFAAEVE